MAKQKRCMNQYPAGSEYGYRPNPLPIHSSAKCVAKGRHVVKPSDTYFERLTAGGGRGHASSCRLQALARSALGRRGL